MIGKVLLDEFDGRGKVMQCCHGPELGVAVFCLYFAVRVLIDPMTLFASHAFAPFAGFPYPRLFAVPPLIGGLIGIAGWGLAWRRFYWGISIALENIEYACRFWGGIIGTALSFWVICSFLWFTPNIPTLAVYVIALVSAMRATRFGHLRI